MEKGRCGEGVGRGGGNLIFLRCRRFYIVMEDATCRGLLHFFPSPTRPTNGLLEIGTMVSTFSSATAAIMLSRIFVSYRVSFFRVGEGYRFSWIICLFLWTIISFIDSTNCIFFFFFLYFICNRFVCNNIVEHKENTKIT